VKADEHNIKGNSAAAGLARQPNDNNSKVNNPRLREGHANINTVTVTVTGHRCRRNENHIGGHYRRQFMNTGNRAMSAAAPNRCNSARYTHTKKHPQHTVQIGVSEHSAHVKVQMVIVFVMVIHCGSPRRPYEAQVTQRDTPNVRACKNKSPRVTVPSEKPLSCGQGGSLHRPGGTIKVTRETTQT
jgi:hypothetical protein